MPAAGARSGSEAGPVSARVFVCARCQAEVLVCSVCDRGRRYCGGECSAQARRASLREAGRRYQSGRAGRFAHARRARRYRQRELHRTSSSPAPAPVAKIVTHQSSQAMDAGDVLAAKSDVAQTAGCEEPAQWHCCWCRRTGRSEVRRSFLHHAGVLPHVAHWSRRGTPHGPSP
jgi:hypothetical protein